MKKAICIGVLFLLPQFGFAADPKPVYKWVSANEYYMIMPTGQSLDISGGGN